MNDLFLTILNMSLVSSVTALVVLALRGILVRRAPRWITYLLWAVVFLRLLLPVSFTSPVSLFQWMPSQTTTAAGQTGAVSRLEFSPLLPQQTPPVSFERENGGQLPTGQENPDTPQVQDPDTAGSSTSSARGKIGWVGIGAIVWASGAGILLGFCLLTYAMAARRMGKLRLLLENDQTRRAAALLPLHKKVLISVSGMFSSPVVFGLIHPRIILPRGFDWEDPSVQHILLHERVHILRRDNLTKMIGTVIVCIHWFNPLVWLCYGLFCRDVEVSCDERVLKILGEDRKKEYARSLLSMAQAQPQQVSVLPFLAFGESNLKKRVGNIMKYHKKTLLSVTAALLSVFLVGCTLLANPSGESAVPASEDQSQSSLPEEEEGIPVKDPSNVIFYQYAAPSMVMSPNQTSDPFYFPLKRTVEQNITPAWLNEQLAKENLTSYLVDSIQEEAGTALISFTTDITDAVPGENTYRDRHLNSVVMTLLQNCDIQSVRVTLNGVEDSSDYVPAALVLPQLSQEEIDALYATLSLETLEKNDKFLSTGYDINRWDLKGDATALKILDAIFQVTTWNNVPDEAFDSIDQAPNKFLLNAAYMNSPNIYWYQNGTEANTYSNFAALSPYVDDAECKPQILLEQVAKQLFGESVSITHQKPRFGYYWEYAKAYTPYHMGGWYPELYLLEYTQSGDKVEAVVAYGNLSGGGFATNEIKELGEETFIRTREQRHRYTLQKTADGSYRLTGYAPVDTQKDLIARAPEYYVSQPVNSGLTLFAWDGVENLTPDQLYEIYASGYAPGVNDTELEGAIVEKYYSTYAGISLKDPTILRQSQYYDKDTKMYRAHVDGVKDRWSTAYWYTFGEVTYPDENTALVPLKVYSDKGRTKLVSDGTITMTYQADGMHQSQWAATGYTPRG